MPLSGRGMLITIMDADPAEEADFNRWYDREHIIERTAIPGFLESRRYVAVDGAPRHVNFYTTESIAVLDSAPYREKLDNPTAWSAHHSPRFRDYTRVVARVTGSKGQGRGGALAFVRIRPPAEGALSNPRADGAARVAAGDWYVAVDGTDVDAVRTAAEPRFGAAPGAPGDLISFGTYRLLWDLAKAELNP